MMRRPTWAWPLRPWMRGLPRMRFAGKAMQGQARITSINAWGGTLVHARTATLGPSAGNRASSARTRVMRASSGPSSST